MTISGIHVREEQEQPTAVIRHRIPLSDTSRIPEWIQQTLSAIQEQGGDEGPAGMPFVRMFSVGEAEMDIEVGWPVAKPFAGSGEVVASSLPGGRVAVATYFGPYDAIAPAYAEVQKWCAENGHEPAGPPWEHYFTDPNEEPDPTKWRTDIHFPLRA